MKKEENMPDEVRWYLDMQIYIYFCWGGMTGSETMQKLTAIEDKYPNWFPWEAKYKSIPNEVHEAYRNEKYGYETWSAKISNGGKGLLETIKEGNIINVNSTSTQSVLNTIKEIYELDLQKNRQEKEQEIADKLLWDKHYKKYGLEYKKNKL